MSDDATRRNLTASEVSPPVPETAGGDPHTAWPLTIGDWRVGRVLGESMGVVLEAQHVRTGAPGALKLVSPSRMGPAATEQFQREWRALRELKHRNIARLLDAGTFTTGRGSAPYYVMELVGRPGGEKARNLVQFAQEKGLTVQQRVALLAAVCSAVQSAHEHGVIHRDLKPANILVDETEGGTEIGHASVQGTPKVMDFGVALVLGAAIVDPSQGSRDGDRAGTWRYMSPEQMRGQTGDIGPWTDVYAIGLIAYELLTGLLPYDISGVPWEQAIRRMERGPRQTAREINPRLDAELARIIDRAVRPGTRDRQASVRELERELVEWLRRSSVWGHVAGGARRRIAAHPVMAILTAGLLGALAAETLGLRAVVAMNLHAPVERWLCMLGSSAADAPLNRVRVIGVDDALNDQQTLDRVRSSLGLEPAPVGDHTALRGVYARLTQRIAQVARPPAIVLDIAMEKPAPQDEAVAADFVAARAASPGTSMIIAMPVVELTPDTHLPSQMSESIARAIPCRGTITGVYEPTTFWSIDLLVKRGQSGPFVSLPAMTFARMQGVASEPEFVFPGREEPAKVVFPRSAADPLGKTIDLPPTLSELVGDEYPELGLRADDIAAKYFLIMPRQEVLDAATIPVVDVVEAAADGSAGESKLWEWFQNRVVIIGDVRAERAGGQPSDIKGYPDGRAIPGVYAQAAAIEWLLKGRALGFAQTPWTYALTAALSLIGAAIGWRAAGPRSRLRSATARLRGTLAGVISLGFVSAVWLAGIYLAFSRGLYCIYPVIGLFGLAAGAALGVALGVVAAGFPRRPNPHPTAA